ncbi:17_t:CDS:2 [Diversispora eburnea]|uniref:17_t:CDS:1 n=1 Tax=Diversispora eburnea TaxID=1213867 RepID=A0A9N9AR99_9GLOM|nr:17_t:CDS:2 [Diversispora eburnea]
MFSICRKNCPAGHSSNDLGYLNHRVALKEINDSSYDVAEILKVYKTIILHSECMTKYYGISRNPSTQNYIIVTELFDDDLHKFLTENFWDLGWETKIDILSPIVQGLLSLNEKDLVHCNLHSGNILIEHNFNFGNFDIASIIDLDSYICNGVRPKVPDFMLNWIPEWYLELMYRCWSDDPSKRPTAIELSNLFCNVSEKLYNDVVDNNVMRQLKIADENQKNTSKSQKQEFLELFSNSNKLHSQSCYISRCIHTLHGLRDLLEDLKSGKSADPNLLLTTNESSINS